MPFVIDRPKGYRKVFQTAHGSMEQAYPLDYGYARGIINPQDGMEADVFVGSGGPIHGRFMKGQPDGRGGFRPDEYKWFTGLTGEEYTRLYAWWHNAHDEGVTWDWVLLDSREDVLADMRRAA